MMYHQIRYKPWWSRQIVITRILKVDYRPPSLSFPAIQATCQRCYSTPSRRPNFFSQLIDNIKQEMAKNKEMKESLKKFREEAQKLEHSEALQKARQKYQAVESEASKTSEVFKESLGSIKDKVQETLDEVGKTDLAKKAGQFREELGKSARGAAESISESGQKIGKSEKVSRGGSKT
uniref:Uncharacterized protein n=1 Tax=Graphocephala atropunctata TaxID=36148 RepID=A0A1B6L4L1_9HEMI